MNTVKLPSSVIHIHVELEGIDSEEEVNLLKEYGGVKRGETISRDILIPATMPLWILHLVLQRSLGFIDVHLYRFESKTRNYGTGAQGNWYPEFPGGSFKRWIKEMYTGPYEEDGSPKVKDCLPLTYIYDFGDYWRFGVTMKGGVSELIIGGVRTKEELEEAIEIVKSENRPVQIAHDGDMLIEDAGNVYGFCDFLKKTNEIVPAVIEERNDWFDPAAMGCDYPAAYDQPEYEHEGEMYLKIEEDEMDVDEEMDEESDEEPDEERDENRMKAFEYLRWAYSQYWHREDYTDFDLL